MSHFFGLVAFQFPRKSEEKCDRKVSQNLLEEFLLLKIYLILGLNTHLLLLFQLTSCLGKSKINVIFQLSKKVVSPL
jgi:hypothetical protein